MTGRADGARILVAVDFEPSSAAAVRLGGDIAAALGASVTIAHAARTELPHYFMEAQVDALAIERRQDRERLARDARAFSALHTGVAVEAVVEEGPAADVIVRLASGFDLIVVGTRRRRGASRWWLGSVAQDVVRRAPVPVLVAPGGEPNAAALSRGAVIIAPVATSDAAEQWIGALQHALHGSVVRIESLSGCPPERLRDAGLIVIPIVPDGDGRPAFEEVVEVLKECSHPVLFVPEPMPSHGRS